MSYTIRFRVLLPLLCIAVSICTVLDGSAVAQQAAEDKGVISLGNEDIKNAPPLNITRERPRARTNAPGSVVDSEEELEDSEEELDTEEIEPESELTEDEEPKVVDSFVVLQGNRRFHLADCKLVKSATRSRSTMNGASVIEGKYISCSICKPPAPLKNPPKPKLDDEVAEADAPVAAKKSPLAPKGRKKTPEPTEAAEPEVEAVPDES